MFLLRVLQSGSLASLKGNLRSYSNAAVHLQKRLLTKTASKPNKNPQNAKATNSKKSDLPLKSKEILGPIQNKPIREPLKKSG